MHLICSVSESKALTPILAARWFAPPCGMCSRNSLHLTRGWSNPRQGWRVYPEHRAGLGWMGLWDIFSLAISAPYMKKKKKLSQLEAQSVHTYSHVYMSVSLYLSCLLFLLTTLSLGDEGNENSHQSTLTHLIREQPSGSSKHFNVWVHWITGVCACVCVGGLSYIKEAGLQKKKKKNRNSLSKSLFDIGEHIDLTLQNVGARPK